MRLILLCLAGLLAVIQYPLWLGKGGWVRVWDLDHQVEAAHLKNDELKARNAKLQSEVLDLREGTGAVEERARFELGMIRESEIFVQILQPNAAGSVPAPALPAAPATPTVPAAPRALVKPPAPAPASPVAASPKKTAVTGGADPLVKTATPLNPR